MDWEKFIPIGKELGLSGKELKEWIDEQHNRERDKRAEDREAARVAHQQEIARLTAERTLLESRCRLAEHAAGTVETVRERGDNSGEAFRSPHKLIPPYHEGRDELDAYIQRFERVATSQGWPSDKWALSLSLCLSGEALSVVGRMSAEDATDYQKLKQALLQRFRYTEEGYCQKFREVKPENSETGWQFAGRLLGYFDHWQQMAKTEKTYEALRDKIVSEQFLLRCDERLAIFLKERGCRDLDKLAEATDHYLEAQGLSNLARGKEERETSKAALQSKNCGTEARKEKVECFLCGKQGHRAADCWTRSKGPKSLSCWKCRKHGHKADECPIVKGNDKEASSTVEDYDRMPAARNDEYQASTTKTEEKASPSARTAVKYICLGLMTQQLPTATGYLDGHPVTVLRDSGCNTVVVRRSLVPEKNFTGIMRTVYLPDGSSKQLPEAKVYVDSPFYRGTTLALCMEKPLYDVVLGNINGVLYPAGTDMSRDPSDVSRLRKESAPAEEPVRHHSVSQDRATLSAATTRRTKETKLPAASNALDVSPQVLKQVQRADHTLEGCFSLIRKTTTKRSANVEFVLIKGILYRRYRCLTRKEVDQLVVPQSLRQFVLKMAHAGVLAGRQGIKRTTDRILEEFYWPGVQAEVTRFVRSCDICEHSVPKCLVGRVPLENMPVIDMPFQRVAIDIIGPLLPTSAKGNCYILTLVDCAT
ncbi:uncharacterized protein LOC119458940 [Dermacentor silvarum]|uniref:uncharacterized protein LOC119458940 n=1 Tax=Dermacentor silvarum TaxID=543639 RepID=UPI001896D474|nr:uncharacterized protein LOC119458940 [Dermacentor silvarum]